MRSLMGVIILSMVFVVSCKNRQSNYSLVKGFGLGNVGKCEEVRKKIKDQKEEEILRERLWLITEKGEAALLVGTALDAEKIVAEKTGVSIKEVNIPVETVLKQIGGEKALSSGKVIDLKVDANGKPVLVKVDLSYKGRMDSLSKIWIKPELSKKPELAAEFVDKALANIDQVVDTFKGRKDLGNDPQVKKDIEGPILLVDALYKSIHTNSRQVQNLGIRIYEALVRRMTLKYLTAPPEDKAKVASQLESVVRSSGNHLLNVYLSKKAPERVGFFDAVVEGKIALETAQKPDINRLAERMISYFSTGALSGRMDLLRVIQGQELQDFALSAREGDNLPGAASFYKKFIDTFQTIKEIDTEKFNSLERQLNEMRKILEKRKLTRDELMKIEKEGKMFRDINLFKKGSESRLATEQMEEMRRKQREIDFRSDRDVKRGI